jgi:hypothetical protein
LMPTTTTPPMPEELSPNRYTFRKKPSDTAIVPIYNHLVSLRDLAISAPLESGTQFMLDLQIPLRNPHPGARQVPKTFTSDCSQSGTVELQLNTALQSGLDGFSQVWTATIVGVPETCLVMKIIQPSHCLLPDPSNLHWRQDYYDPLDLAHNEAWVYQKLAHRQGLSIPYFFGLFDASTPLRFSFFPRLIALFRLSLRLGRPHGPSSSNLSQASRSTTSQNPSRQPLCMIL